MVRSRKKKKANTLVSNRERKNQRKKKRKKEEANTLVSKREKKSKEKKRKPTR